MADYIYIDNLAKKGKIGISRLVFEEIVSEAIRDLPNVEESSKRLFKGLKFSLNRPVRATIRNGVAHIWVALEIKKGIDEKQLLDQLDKNIHAALNEVTEQVPYDVEFKIEKRY
ncbi:MAG: hypothetical protein RBR85_01870 [Bacilli bacterium]|jgi:uncharacterized alkaline shock family protein YloU|nr:hypothetical protein [Bacilli bacterium]